MRISEQQCNYFSRNFSSSEGTMEISQLRSGWSLAQDFFQVLKGRRIFPALLSGQLFLRTVFQTLRVWLISGCRSATPFALTAMILFFTAAAHSQTNALTDAEIQGRALAQKIFEQQPMEDFTNTGIIKVKNSSGKKLETKFEMKVCVRTNGWFSTFITAHTNDLDPYEELDIPHLNNNKYTCGYGGRTGSRIESFANSDFSAPDLGLFFFYWPQQKVLKKEIHRSCGCIVLESTSPYPTNGDSIFSNYSRVVAWIDNDSLGIVEAYAYDAKGKLLKDFYPKDFKKVNGQWQVQTLVMENVQTGSKSRIEFDSKP
jgi:hypothetical protein